jgi:hypothetical protein
MLVALLALLAAPAEALLAVSALTRRRPAAFLVRGSVERGCVLGASALAGGMLALQLALFPELPLAACAPALAVAPWVAGEILSGPSAFRIEALLGAIAAAQLGAVLGSPLPGAIAAAAVYLEVRGPALDDSTIYES